MAPCYDVVLLEGCVLTFRDAAVESIVLVSQAMGNTTPTLLAPTTTCGLLILIIPRANGPRFAASVVEWMRSPACMARRTLAACKCSPLSFFTFEP
jgi:hypothetical protein